MFDRSIYTVCIFLNFTYEHYPFLINVGDRQKANPLFLDLYLNVYSSKTHTQDVEMNHSPAYLLGRRCLICIY